MLSRLIVPRIVIVILPKCLVQGEDRSRGTSEQRQEEWHYPGEFRESSSHAYRVMRYITAPRWTLLTVASRRRSSSRKFPIPWRRVGGPSSRPSTRVGRAPFRNCEFRNGRGNSRLSAYRVRGGWLHRVAAPGTDRYSRRARITRASRLVTPKYAHGKA